jgi:hypothetical protein
MIARIKSDYFPLQHYPIEVCAFVGVRTKFLNII